MKRRITSRRGYRSKRLQEVAPVCMLTVEPLTVLVTSPPNQTVLSGTNVHFTATINSTVAVYSQWMRNGSDLAGVGSSFTLTNVQPSDSGEYRLLATNIYGAVLSSPSQLLVVPSEASINYTLDAETLTFTWPVGYILQAADDVVGPYFDLTNATSPLIIALPPQTNRFYRLKR